MIVIMTRGADTRPFPPRPFRAVLLKEREGGLTCVYDAH